ncbi:MAG TPA: choice-of-anchor tandem repeat NxxGxxAF-containing protein, partial [Candidatus Polarisedimenticolia bacterium]|nr:choice-of-anchor tandem repeat NxxGxxAF-containing protein [Candidatus Polarisedimenticolia bacterium]
MLLRIPPGGGAPTTVLKGGQSLEAPGGSAIYGGMTWPMGVAVDGAGRAIVIAVIDFTDEAIVRVPPSGPPEVLVRTGEALGPGTIERLASAPGVSPSGLVVFAAELDSGDQVIATVQPGSAPVALQTFEANPEGWPGPLDYSTPVVDDAGDVAFLRGWDATGMELRGIVGGVQRILAAPGSPLPDGDAVSSVCCAPIAIDAAGAVLFGAYGDGGSQGVYRVAASIEAVVRSGDDLGGGVTLSTIHLSSSPALANDGTVAFTAWDTSGGYGLFSTTGTTIRRELSGGDPIAGPGRFMSVASSGGLLFGARIPPIFPPPSDPYPLVPFPYQGVGPSLSHGGRMIFDAMLVGGARGLFFREPDGTLSAVALDGDPAPGGGVFEGPYLSYHSINDAGTVAFLAPMFTNRIGLFYGPAGGPLDRLLGTGDSVPGSVETVLGFLPPSRVDAGGSLAIPLSLSDGSVVLLGWDGTRLVRVAGPGDVIPGQGAIQSLVTGASDRLLP